MKLKLLAPFRCPGLMIRSEMQVDDPSGYSVLWDVIEDAFRRSNDSLRWSDAVETLHFAHASRHGGRQSNRYRTIDADSLLRPMHVLEIVVDSSMLGVAHLLEADSTCATTGSPADDPRTTRPEGQRDANGMMEAVDSRLQTRPPRILLRVYDVTISLMELDLELDPALLPEDVAEIAETLDRLQQLGIDLAERLATACERQILRPLFSWIENTVPSSERFLRFDTGFYDPNTDATERAQTHVDAAPASVLWVTRTLILEERDCDDSSASACDTRSAVIRHWLKDVEGSEDGEVVTRIIDDPTASSTHWLNYLFRERAGAGPYPERGWSSGPTGLAQPFCAVWEAMTNAQYYYAAFDLLQTVIHRVLARSYTPSSALELRSLKAQLDDVVKESNLVILDYRENFKYYRRAVHAAITEILDQWGFDSVLLEQIQHGIDACNERIQELHAGASARSSMYTDLILLSIGVTSVFGILLGLLDYGRTLAGDVSLAAYERGSFNFIDWIAAHSTDGILLVAAIVSTGLVGLYFHFKRQQLL